MLCSSLFSLLVFLSFLCVISDVREEMKDEDEDDHRKKSIDFKLSKEKIKIHLDKKWWMWSDQATFLPPSDEKIFNDMVLYFRRGHGGSPYKRYLKKDEKIWRTDD